MSAQCPPPSVSVFRSIEAASERYHIRKLKVFDSADTSLNTLSLTSQDMVNGIMFSLENLIKDLKSKEFPEARAYLHILGEELGFVKLHDLQLLGRLLLNGVRTLQGIPQMVSGPDPIAGSEISLWSSCISQTPLRAQPCKPEHFL